MNLKDNPDIVFYTSKITKKKMWFNKNWSIKDVTKNFMKGKKPGTGKITKDPEFKTTKKTKEEVQTALWIKKNFGGNIHLNNYEEHQNEPYKQPDFVWGGDWWGLKCVDGLNGINRRLYDAIDQINSNPKHKPGGAIIDITNSGVTKAEAIAFAKRRLSESARTNMHVIIKDKSKVVSILQAKKKNKK